MGVRLPRQIAPTRRGRPPGPPLATVLGLMERPEPAGPIAEHLADGDAPELPPLTHERRNAWGDRRQEPDER